MIQNIKDLSRSEQTFNWLKIIGAFQVLSGNRFKLNGGNCGWKLLKANWNMFLEKGCCLNSFGCEPILEKFSYLKISCHHSFIFSLNNLMDFHNSLFMNTNSSVILSAEWRLKYFFNNTSFYKPAASLRINLIQLWR